MSVGETQRNQTLNQLKNIPVNVYLFGSWARKEENV